MSIYKVHEKLDYETENGAWLDYSEHSWLFFIKDDSWSKEEKRQSEKKEAKVGFVEMGMVDIFTFEVFDTIETSDFPFSIHEGSEELIKSLEDKEDYKVVLLLVDKDNIVVQKRMGNLSKEHSQFIKAKLTQQLKQAYDEDSFSREYEKIASKYEPFELEPFYLFHQVI